MAKDPAFLFYSSDFMTGTQFMSDEQVGKYVRLLCAQHQHGELSEKHMMHICRSYDKDIFDKFEKTPDGNYYNKRLLVETNKRAKFSESRSQNRLKGINRKKEKENTSSSYDASYDHHMENENENIIENIGKENKEGLREKKEKREKEGEKSLNYPFERFWNEYDKKVGDKAKLQRKWEGLTDEDRSRAIEVHIPAYKIAQPDKQYRKDPSTYLNNKSFNDEIIQSHGSGIIKSIAQRPDPLAGFKASVNSAREAYAAVAAGARDASSVEDEIYGTPLF